MGNLRSCRASLTDEASNAAAIRSLCYPHIVCGYLLPASDTVDLALESRLQACADHVANKHHLDSDTESPTIHHETQSPEDKLLNRERKGNGCDLAHTPQSPATNDDGTVSSRPISELESHVACPLVNAMSKLWRRRAQDSADTTDCYEPLPPAFSSPWIWGVSHA